MTARQPDKEMSIAEFADVWEQAMADLDLSIEDSIALRAKLRKLGYGVLGETAADRRGRRVS